MKKKLIIHEFDPLIYPRKLWVCTNATVELTSSFELDEGDMIKSLEMNAVTTYITRNLKTEKLGVLVFCKNKKLMTVSNIAHESVHVADAIFEAIGGHGEDFSIGNEPYAYLVGWVAGSIDEVLKVK